MGPVNSIAALERMWVRRKKPQSIPKGVAYALEISGFPTTAESLRLVVDLNYGNLLCYSSEIYFGIARRLGRVRAVQISQDLRL